MSIFQWLTAQINPDYLIRAVHGGLFGVFSPYFWRVPCERKIHKKYSKKQLSFYHETSSIFIAHHRYDLSASLSGKVRRRPGPRMQCHLLYGFTYTQCCSDADPVLVNTPLFHLTLVVIVLRLGREREIDFIHYLVSTSIESKTY
jgi:hypothetical protein